VEHYNNVRLNSAIGYTAPKDMLAGRQQEIHAKRDQQIGGGAETTADSPAEGRWERGGPISERFRIANDPGVDRPQTRL
ncbi:MAG: hypothetical protein QOK38_1055, partial [Acidobacteriaceae bacterium]|nr:hypothetical protein [Acidobacteriaceae bacterium]